MEAKHIKYKDFRYKYQINSGSLANALKGKNVSLEYAQSMADILCVKVESVFFVEKTEKLLNFLTIIKVADPKTVISRWFILQLIRSEEITPLKYGDAWLINTDELYGYLSGGVPQDLNYQPQLKRDLMTSGEIWRMFLTRDAATKIRKLNIRLFVKEQGIWYFVSPSRKWYIDFNAFMEKINPRHINERVEIPRLRWHDDSVRNFKRTHPELKGATMTVAEQALKFDKVFKTLNAHRRIMNYDRHEQTVISILNAKQPPLIRRLFYFEWCARMDSNHRHRASEARALSN